MLAILFTALVAACYAAGVHRVWARAGRGHGVASAAVWWFAGGCVVLAAALAPAADPWTDALFSAHMVQHLLLISVVAPMLVLGQPVVALLWAIPDRARIRLGRGWAAGRGLAGALRGAVAGVTAPSSAWLLHLGTLILWHIPACYRWASAHEAAHAAEHASYLLTASLFWWPVCQSVGHRRLGDGAAILYLMSFVTVMGAYAAVLTFARTPWYATDPMRYGFTAVGDQQLAGMIMWVPASVVYLVAAGACFVRWLHAARDAAPDTARDAVSDAGYGESDGGTGGVYARLRTQA
jgi:cytochrome c oxidase assembly factor CtaG